MNILELLKKKRLGKELTNEEIKFLIDGVSKDSFKDYELSALLMAICINGMTNKETTALTLEMANSGDIVDLSNIDGVKADKHSTGGISDTTTLIVVPVLSALGIKMAKMSGRSLGFTGGTADKVEAISGFKTEISNDQFINNIKTIGASIITQTANIAPADKKLYALRDITETVESIPLIASSIMSKKLASGADVILLDVKFGSGAFMKNEKDAHNLAKLMITIGKNAGKKMCAVISNMDQPLGNGIGCNLEVRDAVEVLNGKQNRLAELSVIICVEILKLAYGWTESCARNKVLECIKNKTALKKLIEIVKNQGGDVNLIKNPKLFKKAKYSLDVYAKKQGYVTKINGEMLGNACKHLGGGRQNKEDKILHEVGIDLKTELNSYVTNKNIVATVYYNTKKSLNNCLELIYNAFTITEKPIKKFKLVSKIVK